MPCFYISFLLIASLVEMFHGWFTIEVQNSWDELLLLLRTLIVIRCNISSSAFLRFLRFLSLALTRFKVSIALVISVFHNRVVFGDMFLILKVLLDSVLVLGADSWAIVTFQLVTVLFTVITASRLWTWLFWFWFAWKMASLFLSWLSVLYLISGFRFFFKIGRLLVTHDARLFGLNLCIFVGMRSGLCNMRILSLLSCWHLRFQSFHILEMKEFLFIIEEVLKPSGSKSGIIWIEVACKCARILVRWHIEISSSYVSLMSTRGFSCHWVSL